MYIKFTVIIFKVKIKNKSHPLLIGRLSLIKFSCLSQVYLVTCLKVPSFFCCMMTGLIYLMSLSFTSAHS